MSVVGIDLGTTNTVVGCVRAGKVHVLADEKGVRLLPSVVSFHPNGEVLVGGAAKARRVIDAKNTVYSHKRLIGRSWGSPEITQARQRFAFELREGPGQGPLVHARQQDYTLPEISAFVLKRARQIAEQALGTPVERAVITVPAHFNELQRASTKVAGRVSGLEVLRILNEPTAAALAYGLGRTGNERVAVYDFGGGTFDCTLLDLNGNVFEVLATAGDSFLGGDDVDAVIADRMAEAFLKQHRQDAKQDPQMSERLKTTAEDIKIALSTAETHTVVLKDFGHGAGGASLTFQFTMTRRDLDALLTPLVDRTFKVTQDALSLARLSPTSFDKVILVGGSTRMPLVRKRVEAFFGAPPMDRVNPDEVVAIGAAIQAAALTEGIRRRSIPAPPGVPGRPGGDTQENTQTSELNPAMLKPAFGSAPPAFGFASTVGSQPPGLGFASTVGSAPPPGAQQTETQTRPPVQPPGVPGAKGPPQPSLRSTHPGVAPATQPGSAPVTQPGVAPITQPGSAPVTQPGVAPVTQRGVAPATQRGVARPAPKPGAPTTQASEDDPSMASFPDLAAPTPFEWFPSSGMPSSGGAKPGGATSERTFGSNDPSTLTQQAGPAAAQAGPRPAAGAPPAAQARGPGFGAIDEPPSLFSTPSASVPSFPSMSAAGQPVPSPIGDAPAPWRQEPEAPSEAIPDGGPFGALADLSLVSTTGVSTPGVDDGGFGHVSDLSLISNQTATAAMEAITKARSEALEAGQFDDETEAFARGSAEPGKGSTVQLDPASNPAAKPKDDHDSLLDRADLPAVVARAKPARKPGQVGMSPQGGAPAMLGKPPPLIAPQPFGPMQKVTRSLAALAHGGDAVPQRAPAAAPAAKPARRREASSDRGAADAGARRTVSGDDGAARRRAASTGETGGPEPAPRPARHVRLARGAAAPAPSFAPPAPAPPFAPPPRRRRREPRSPSSSRATARPAGAAPSYGAPPQQSAYAAGAPPMQSHFSAPPPPQQQPFSFGSAPPPGGAAASQPPIFGAFSSAPPAQDPSAPLDYPPGAFEPNIPPAPAAPHGIQYQTPVLVDVTPRGLVVETAGGYTDTIIPRNSKIPCERTRRFATGRDMQTTVRVRVAQGESPGFAHNTYLGEVELSGLRPAPRGEVTVAVTFEVDADGTLRVRARDVQTGQEARATLQLVGVADESSVVMMINRFANQPVVGGSS
ncbi:MAG: Hsp70 family protein [Labilithrix sp.]|nr:Hsp70 family protein [Labilithrix sp.]